MYVSQYLNLIPFLYMLMLFSFLCLSFAFLTTEYSELVPAKALYWACSLFLLKALFEEIPHFSSYPSAGQPSEALLELPSDIACCERSAFYIILYDVSQSVFSGDGLLSESVNEDELHAA